jgi:thymidylate synthase (FAD)
MKVLKEPVVAIKAMTFPVEQLSGFIYPKLADTEEEGISTGDDYPISGSVAARVIEEAARNCYRSISDVAAKSAEHLVASLVTSGHEAMFEFVDVTLSITCGRDIATQILRHRHAFTGEHGSFQEVGPSFAQESTRYCNYSKSKFGGEVTFFDPHFQGRVSSDVRQEWLDACEEQERQYLKALSLGEKPEDARAFLGPTLATTLFMKTNLRDWRHFLELRLDEKHAHHLMVMLAKKIAAVLHVVCPVLFP